MKAERNDIGLDKTIWFIHSSVHGLFTDSVSSSDYKGKVRNIVSLLFPAYSNKPGAEQS
jgi:hypothetical protein